MTDAPTAELLDWAARQVHPGASVTAIEALRGGLTAAMHRLTVSTPAGARDVVLRQWPDAAWADGLVAREADALAAVERSGVPVPRLVAADDGAATGIRCTLTTALPGAPDLAPADLAAWLAELAAAQAAIHAVAARPPTRWDGWYDETPDRALDWIADAGLRERAREAAALAQDPELVLVHGDYQHFNVLWRGGRLSGVVDWPNAATGRRGGDVGHCRLNLAVLFGADAAARYFADYAHAAGVLPDPVADLRALLCFDHAWQEFIPVQLGRRAALDVAGMADRVTAVVRAAVDALG